MSPDGKAGRNGRNRGGGGGKRSNGANRAGGGKGGGETGAALGTQVLRYSGIHGLGMVISNALTFISTIVIANFSEPAEFGQLGLLMFFSGLLTLLFTLASKQGTLKRTFGGDDDDDDEDEDEEVSISPQRSFGTGIATITLVATLGTGLSILFADQISEVLLSGADQSLIIWAAVAGGTGAVYRVTSIAIWIERRPYPYIAVESAKPVFMLAVIIPLLIAGYGIEGAIAGQAIGTGLATLFSLVVLKGSWTPCFDPAEAVAIYRKGAIRIPLVLSMWVVSYADIFILSRFVSDAELGTYHLASRAAFLVAILPGGYRKALRPLQKTPMFRAVEDEYGVGTARGTQFGYFAFMTAGTLLATTVMATALVRVAPSSYADAAPLIPLLAGGLVAPTVYRMMNKSVKYADKRIPFIIGAVVAMFLFVGLALLLIPIYGDKGAPLAMIGAFVPPTAFIFIRSQRGRSPLHVPWRSIILSSVLAVAVAFAHGQIDPGGLVLQVLAGVAAIVLWLVLCLLAGAVPRAHRAPLIAIVRGLTRRGQTFEAAAGLEALTPRERKVLRRAVLKRMPPKRAAEPLTRRHAGSMGGRLGRADHADASAAIVILLRRAAVGGGAPGLPHGYEEEGRPKRDSRIGEFLFCKGSPAERDKLGKKLINDGVADPFDLHTLEAVIGSLRKARKPIWRGSRS